MCRLDAKCERPELRVFDNDGVEVALEQRGQLVAAALTILRAWHVTNDTVEIQALGGFE
jgi:putative DNA primase/helicase